MDISVVIPLYNKREFIERAITSIMGQSFQPREIVVVDDGSTDGSAELVSAMNIPSVRLVSQKNGGVSVARNRGVKEATSAWVAFLDGDDEWMPEFLATVKRMHDAYPDRDVYASAYYLGNYRGEKKPMGLNGVTFAGEEGVLSNYFHVAAMSAPPICSSTVCIRKQALLDVGGFPLSMKSGEDLITWARLAARRAPAYCTKPLAVFWQEKAHTYDDKPNRLPEEGDPVGLALVKLKTASSGNLTGIDLYISHWHKMRASIYLRLNMRRKALVEMFKGIYYNPSNSRLYAYLFMSLFPYRLIRSLFKTYAG